MRKFNFIFGFILLAFLNTGCTAIGVAIGATIDGKTAKYEAVSDSPKPDSLDSNAIAQIAIEPGTDIRVTDQHGAAFEGKFTGLKYIDETPCVKLKQTSQRYVVSIDSISQVQIKHSSSKGAISGFIVGAAIDAVILISLSQIDIMGEGFALQ